jgi:tetratricopeptide (TPR) repeat protein
MSDEWALINIDEKMAKRHGIPAKLPIPKSEIEGLADTGLPPDKVRKWMQTFMQTLGPNLKKAEPALASQYEAFLGKGDNWKKAEEAFAKGDVARAISALKMVVAVDPNDHAARMNLASAFASSGDHAKAQEHLKTIRATFEGEPDYHVMCAQVHLAKKERDPAIGELVLALEAKPDHQTALDLLLQLGVLLAVYEDPKDAASLTYVRADSVVAYLEEVWGQADRNAEYFLDQIAYHSSEQRWPLVLGAAERAAKIAPDDERFVRARVNALVRLGRAGEALEIAQQYATSHPTSGALVELARAEKAAGKDASATIDRALAADAGDLEALDIKFWPEDRADLQLVQNAIPALQAHADAHPVPGAIRSLARAKLTTGATDEALALFKRAVDLTPADDDLRSEWWVELTKAQKTDELLKDSAAIDVTKHNWKLRWSEAEAYAAQGKNDEAYACFLAINGDETLLVDVRKRAKRAAEHVRGGAKGAGKTGA